MSKLAVGFLVACAFALTPQRADAQVTVSPFLGTTSAGDSGSNAATVGLSAGWMGNWIGGEADLAWSPDYFGRDRFLDRRHVVTLMGNAIVSPWRGAVRPHGVVGLGVIHPSLAEPGRIFSVEANTPAWNAGGGLTWFRKNIGVRGDLRYFRGMRDSEHDINVFGVDFSRLSFWRASIGLTVGVPEM